MIILDVPQLSDEWFSARVGVPSASNFDKIITMSGKPSTQRQKYLYQLAGEKVTGCKEESYQNAAMLRGIELEPEARNWYEWHTGNDVTEVGLCYLDDNKNVSCSPDGLIGEAGGLEIKCPSLSVHAEYLYSGKIPATYYQQVQGSLYVTSRKWWDFLSYYPGKINSLLVTVERDEKFITKLADELEKFNLELDKIYRKIA